MTDCFNPTPPKIIFFTTKRFYPFLENYYPYAVKDEYWLMVSYFGDVFYYPMFDRTGTLDQGFLYYIVDRIPTNFNDFDKDLFDIIDQRGKEIVQQSVQTKQDIYVWWSGGIDSTVALVSILKHIKDLSKLNVVMNRHSIVENSDFYESFIKNKINTLTPKQHFHLYERDNYQHIVVTGEYGDNLFGPLQLSEFTISELYSTDFWSIFEKKLVDKHYSNNQILFLINYLQKQTKQSPITIECTYDFLWWVAYSLLWQKMDFLIKRKFTKDLSVPVTHFFRSTNFELWALKNQKNLYFHCCDFIFFF